ncbi:hypothetical protein [Neobacillus muris]|uniref:hypothetical protein n=1 Tax=Neobacillus muris TaxID=2941334 RepID=UPI00203B85D4|nr:hypothetical protein [Neobacillus muris]
MDEKGLCKGCQETVYVQDDAIEQMIGKAEEEEPFNIVSDEIYSMRLQHCESCPSLKYGTTCAYSGCIVRYRAKFKNKSCPNAKETKWKKII